MNTNVTKLSFESLRTMPFDEVRDLARQGKSEAQCEVGLRLLNGQGVEKNEGAAVTWFRLAANQGCADGQFSLGICYVDGKGVEKDAVMAIHWLTVASKQGNQNALYEIFGIIANETMSDMSGILCPSRKEQLAQAMGLFPKATQG